MPQLDFLIYSYQYILLFITFFLLYDMVLNYWLPAFLSNIYILNRRFSRLRLIISFFRSNSFIERYYLLIMILYLF